MNPKVIERIDETRNDRLHGAGWLSRQAISTLNLAMSESEAHTIAEFIEEIKIVAAELAKARPSMISVANYVNQLLQQVILGAQTEKDLDSLRSLAQSKASELTKLSEEATSKATEYGYGIIGDQDTVITCSYSSTVCEAFQLARQKGKEFQVLVAESRTKDKSYGEITAKQLKQHLIPVQVVPDKYIHLRMSKVGKALVGADSILSDGSLINGMPTHTLASAAKKQNIPFYTVCETAKFDTQGYIAEALEPELGFDKTPPALITGIITEKGIIKPNLVIAYVEQMSRFPL
jgi:translation initiation factor 2B subunit (eIF-2B alpha/beta/delta family)